MNCTVPSSVVRKLLQDEEVLGSVETPGRLQDSFYSAGIPHNEKWKENESGFFSIR